MAKLLLVLDLDETLVHAREDALLGAPDWSIARYHVYKRPHVDWFLETVLARYEVAIWTAAGRTYAEAVVDRLLGAAASKLAFLWCAERCTQRFDHETRNRDTVKKLLKVRRRGYDLARVVAVDDTASKYQLSYGNLVVVPPFEGDRLDQELSRLARYLAYLDGFRDVRPVEKRGWRSRAAGDDF
ncbi:MAG: HAD family hydrolase [Polyangiaceae bacterium]|nr:HAD family hydrolase [Polyangiaceae bacterium]